MYILNDICLLANIYPRVLSFVFYSDLGSTDRVCTDALVLKTCRLVSPKLVSVKTNRGVCEAPDKIHIRRGLHSCLEHTRELLGSVLSDVYTLQTRLTFACEELSARERFIACLFYIEHFIPYLLDTFFKWLVVEQMVKFQSTVNEE